MRLYLSIILFCLHGLSLAKTDIFPFRKGDNWYYTDNNFNRLSEKIYEEAYPFRYDYAVVKIDGKYGFIDKQENLIIPAMYDSAFVQPRGGFEVKLNNEKFLIDLNNKRQPVVVGCGTFGTIVGPYYLQICEENDQFGVDNLFGNNIPAIYDSISLETYSRVVVVMDSLKRFGIYDDQLKMTYPVKLDSIQVIRERSSVVHIFIYRDGKIGAVNGLGEVMAFPKYDNLNIEYFYATSTILDNGQKGYIINGIEYWSN